MSPRPNSTTSGTISFRLNEAALGRLVEDAAKQGLSRGELARKLVIGALEEPGRREVLDEIRRLRRDLAATLEAVLLNIGGVNQEQVREFVRRKLQGGGT